MALDKWASKILTSLHGRKLGIDDKGFLVGTPGTRHPLETVTAASTLADSGVSVITSASAIDTTLTAPPYVGCEKIIVNGSTYANTVNRSTANGACSIYASTGTEQEGRKITFAASVRPSLHLVGITTDQWGVVNSGSTVYWSVSTST